MDFRIRAWAHVPVLPLNKRSRAVKKILPIVQVKNRKTAVRLFVVSRREIHHQASLVTQELGTEIFVSAELSVAQGVIVTSRSLASTFCPGATRSFVTRPETGA